MQQEDSRTEPRGSILHIIDEFKFGGAQTHLVTILREALRAFPNVGHKCMGLFGDGPIAEDVRSLGIETEVLDLRPLLARRSFFRAAATLRERIREHAPYVVEAHLTWSRLLGLYAAWREGVPRRIGFEQGDIFNTSWKFKLANFLGQHFAHSVIVCSRALGDWVRRTHHVSQRRIEVFHNCVDTERFRPPSGQQDVAEFDRPECSTLFCAVGSLGRGVNKRMDVCIRAVAAARDSGADVGLVICGDGEQLSELKELGSDLEVTEHIKFLGLRRDMPQVMAGCDAFCHAAPFEPFGIVCIEAMATGLPAIVPDSGGMQEAVDDGVTGIVYHVLDHEALGSAMAKLAADSDARQRMGDEALKAVVGSFAVRPYVKRLYGLYGLSERPDEENGA